MMVQWRTRRVSLVPAICTTAQLDAVEARFFREHGAAAELLDDVCNFIQLGCSRHDQFSFADIAVLVANRCMFERAQRGRGHRRDAARVACGHVPRSDPTAMPRRNGSYARRTLLQSWTCRHDWRVWSLKRAVAGCAQTTLNVERAIRGMYGSQ